MRAEIVTEGDMDGRPGCETCDGSGLSMVVLSVRYFDTIQPETGTCPCWDCHPTTMPESAAIRLLAEMAASIGGCDMRIDYTGPAGEVGLRLVPL